jgi:hypothetical protein
MSELAPGIGSYRDRHGKVRWRYRKANVCVQLPGSPGGQEFVAAVENAMAGLKPATRPNRRASALKDLMVDHYCRGALPRAKHRAQQKKVPFNLTQLDFRALMVDQEFRCAVSNIAFPIQRVSDPEMRAFRPSIDRITPQLGYVPGNVRLVCEIVNTAMNAWGQHALIVLVEQMANHLGLTQRLTSGRRP